MKRNNNRAVAKTTKIPEPIMKWTMDNINHSDERTVQTINGMYVYIGEVNRLIKERERMAKTSDENSVLHIFSVMPRYLKERRQALNLSMQEVTNETGISKATISRIERGNDAYYKHLITLHQFYSDNGA